ncbi:MAG: N-acetylmuramoyl-L-alanine amidase, partial [Candidatus Kapaibacterium sp.]
LLLLLTLPAAAAEAKVPIRVRISDQQVGMVDQPAFLDAQFTRVRSFLDRSAQVYTATVPRSGMTARVRMRTSRIVEVIGSVTESSVKDGMTVREGTTSDGKRDDPTAASVATTRSIDAEKKKWRFDCVVIDAGHGGKDDGAESVNGWQEKDATMAIAGRLRDELRRRMPGLRVVLTRSTDIFIPLHERGSIANRADGKLFISIHCNSVSQKPSKARGCETYILSPAKTAAAIDVAARENGVVQLEDERERSSGMTEDRQVLATLAQTSFAKFSSAFALAVQKHLAPGTGLPDRGVSQAGFLVLVCASMPAVLVETGFISNPADERLLFAKDGQRRIARGIASAVVEYASAYATVVGR